MIAPVGRASEEARIERAHAGSAGAEAPFVRVHPAGGEQLFGFPGAVARAKENPLRLAGALAFAEGARRRMRAIGAIDRVIAHWIVPSAWPLLAGVDAPIDLVSHGADVRMLVKMPAPLREAIVRSLLDRGARFQFVATHLLDALAGSVRGEIADRLRSASRVEPAPIDLPDVGREAARVREELAMKPAEPLAVCVGRLVPEKRYDLALAGLAHAAPHVRLAIVGDGPERARLTAMAAATGVRATSTGALPRREALAWIAAADVLVHPSAHEGAPTVVREARALGTHVVACAAGDLERWAALDAGIAIVPPDARAIGAAVKRAAERSLAT